MAHTLTIHHNDNQITIERNDLLILVFKDQYGNVTESSILTINDLEPMMIARTDEIMSRPSHELPPPQGKIS